MTKRHQAPSEHDPEISALYHSSGGLEPPTSLDEAILAKARVAARQRRHRWMLPLSTAAVVMLSVTVLLKINSERLFGPSLKEHAPTTQSETRISDSGAPSFDIAPRQRAREEKSAATAEQKPSTTSPELEARDGKTAPSPLGNTPKREPPQTAASEKAVAESLKDEAEPQIQAETTLVPGLTASKPTLIKPESWIEKIRKLLKEKKAEQAQKELGEFKKQYPDYKLPDDLSSL